MLPTTKTISATKSLLISTTTGIVIVTIAILILGLLVDRKIESIMILHDFYIVLAIITGTGFIAVLYYLEIIMMQIKEIQQQIF
jgi:hypothetical protein